MASWISLNARRTTRRVGAWSRSRSNSFCRSSSTPSNLILTTSGTFFFFFFDFGPETLTLESREVSCWANKKKSNKKRKESCFGEWYAHGIEYPKSEGDVGDEDDDVSNDDMYRRRSMRDDFFAYKESARRLQRDTGRLLCRHYLFLFFFFFLKIYFSHLFLMFYTSLFDGEG